jgi:hypothetical protein
MEFLFSLLDPFALSDIYWSLNILAFHNTPKRKKKLYIFVVSKMQILPCLFVPVDWLSCQLLFGTDAIHDLQSSKFTFQVSIIHC